MGLWSDGGTKDRDAKDYMYEDTTCAFTSSDLTCARFIPGLARVMCGYGDDQRDL